jgi:hypothetical protein
MSLPCPLFRLFILVHYCVLGTVWNLESCNLASALGVICDSDVCSARVPPVIFLDVYVIAVFYVKCMHCPV